MDNDLVHPGFNLDDGPQEDSSEFVADEETLSPSQVPAQTQTQEQVNQHRHKNKNPFKERISKLINENHTKDQINMNLQTQLAEKERLLNIRDQELRQKEINNQKLFENSLQSEEQAVVQRLRNARDDGDIDKEIQFQQDLARIKGEQAAFGVLKYQQQQSYQEPPQETTFYPENNYNPNQYSQAYEPELPDAYVDFADRNPWINPNVGEYSPELAEEANVIAQEFNKRLKFNNQANLIGTDEYYSAIENVMRENYSLNSQQTSTQVQEKQYRSTPVGGVSRQGASMADQYVAKTSSNGQSASSLTPDEYKIARNLRVLDPNNPTKYISGNEVLKMYEQAKNFYAKQPHDPKYRITID